MNNDDPIHSEVEIVEKTKQHLSTDPKTQQYQWNLSLTEKVEYGLSFSKKMRFFKSVFRVLSLNFEKIMYPTGVPHLERKCTPRVPHLRPFVPHSTPSELAALI